MAVVAGAGEEAAMKAPSPSDERRTDQMLMVACLALCAFLLYYSLAATVFEYRNPKANRSVLISHFWSVLTWKKLDRFQ